MTNVLNYIDFERVNTLLEGFNQSTGFVTAILDLEGNILSKSGWRRICTEFHRVNPETSLRCTHSDTVLSGKIKKDEKYHYYKCLNGLIDVAVPIIIKGQHIANLFSGQFFFEKPDKTFFKKQAAKYGFNETAYLKVLEDVPVIPEEKVKTIIDFLLNMTQLISDMTYQRMELMKLNKNLQTNEERYRLVLENSIDAILLTSPDGSIFSANPAACKMFQRTEEEICNAGRNQLVDVSDPRLYTMIEERNRTGSVKGELFMLRKDGTKFPVELSTSVFADQNGRLLSSMVIRDITERKKSEEQLIRANQKIIESEINFRLLVENAPEAIFIQVDSKFAYLNKAAADLYGASNEEQLLGTEITDRIHPESIEFVKQRISQLNDKQIKVSTAEYKHLKIDNSAIEVSVSAVPFKFQNKSGALVFARDITKSKMQELSIKQQNEQYESLNEELKQTVEELYETKNKIEESEQKFRGLFTSMQEGVYLHELIYDKKGKAINYKIIEANPISEKYLNIKPEFAIGKTATELFGTDEAPFLEIYANVVETGVPKAFEQYFPPMKKYFFISVFSPQEGQFATVFLDITERKNTIKALKRSESELKKAQQITHIGSWYLDIETNEVVWTEELYKMYGFDPTLPPPPYTEHMKLFTPESWELLSKSLENTAKNGEPYELELNTIRKDGESGWMWARGEAVRDSEGKIIGLWGAAQDITARKKFENELRESKEQLKFAFEGSNDGLWDVNMKTGGVFINSRGCEILGYKPDEIEEVTKVWSDLVHPDDLAITNKNLQDHIENRIPVFEVEQRLRMKSGEWKWILARGKVVSRDSNGAPLRMTGTHTDISERVAYQEALIKKNMELEASEEELRAANEELTVTYENLRESTIELEVAKEKAEENEKHFSAAFYSHPFSLSIITKSEGKILDVNNACTNFYGYSREQLLNFTTSELHLWDNDSDRTKALKELASTGRLKLLEARTKIATGEIRTILLSAEPVFWKGQDCFITSTIDITERKLLEVELVKAKEKAEESNRLKTAFLQNMSHEIRTPMNAIIGFSELFVRNLNNKAKLEYFSEIIKQRSNDLLDIVNDLLDIAKIESGQLSVNIENCSIRKLFGELTVFFTELQKRQKKQHVLLNIHLGEPPDFKTRTDVGKLKQIFINLIGNAFKFTNEGSVEVSYTIDNDQYITFFVTDTGIGIREDKQQVIFERFIQLEQGPNRMYGGTGLGLSIVKGLVDLLNGKLWLKSEPGKGSTFYFSIPLNNSEKIETEQIVSETNPITFNFKNKTLLIVEDDIFNAEYIREILSSTELNLLQATYGNEAIQLAISNSPDLILMDIGLPDMSGYDVIHRIKQHRPKVKIIAQTAYAADEDRKKAMDSGCIDYISKPLKQDLLLSMIHKHLNTY